MSKPIAREADAIARVASNAFYVLGIPTTANRFDILRAEANLLEAIAQDRPGASTYDTPVGRRTRDVVAVRAAAAALADPDRRIDHELWAVLPAAEQYRASPPAEGWLDADAAFGWRLR